MVAPSIVEGGGMSEPSITPAIEVRNMGKEYRLYGNPIHRILEKIQGPGKQRHVKVHALQDIDFSVDPGSTVGLVGPNGAGKSTLLKIMTGTTFPTSGSYRIRGKVASLLELGAGFHMDFSGRDNIYLNASMMGLSKEETHRKYEEILEFSELASFIHAPIRTYSSGMICRLGFSTAIAVDPDVLIIDEILAVGDMHFQRKCVERIWDFKERGKTIFFCSHSLYDVRQICDQAMWIEGGRIKMMDDAVFFPPSSSPSSPALLGPAPDVLDGLPGEALDAGPSGPHVVSAAVLDATTLEPTYEIKPGADVLVRVHFKNYEDEPDPLCLGVGFTRTDTTNCFAHTTEMDGVVLEQPEAVVDLLLPSLRLLSGEFVVAIYLMDGKGVHRFHQFLTPENLVVMHDGKDIGLFLQDHEWQVREGGR